MSSALFVLGAPGVGKTSAIRPMLDEDSGRIARPKWTVGAHVVAPGHYTGKTFDGADSVPYNGVQDCLDYWEANFMGAKRLTVIDGDRFSYAKVRDYFTERTDRTVAVLLHAPPGELARRRAIREHTTGRVQNERWARGRETKAVRFFETFPETHRIAFDVAKGTPEELAYFMFCFALEIEP
jgi:hypothetical protein